MATPHVAALAALMWSEAPHLSATDIVEILKATCRQPEGDPRLTFLDAAGNISTGRGIIDAYAALCELKTRVCLVLDRSESMDKSTGIDGLTRLEILKIVAGDLIDLVDIGSSLGIISFNENHDEVVPLSLVENPVTTPNEYLGIKVVPNKRVTWRNRVNFLKAEGFTSIGNGVIAARTMLGQLGPPGQPGQPAQPGQPSQPSQPSQPAQPAQPGLPGQRNQRKAIIVLTDGQENRGPYLEDLPIFPDDIPVFGLGWGSPGNIQPAGLLSLAENTGGYLVMADQFDQDWFQTISKYLTQIVGEISGYETVLDPAGKIKAGETDNFDFLLGDTDTSAEVIIIKPADKPLELRVFSPDNKPWKDLRTWTPSSGRVLRSRFSLPGDYLAESRNYYGKWKAEVSMPEGSPEVDEVPYTLLVRARSTLKMKCRIRQSALVPGSTLELQIDLTEGGIRLGSPAKVSVKVMDPTGKQHDVEPDHREAEGLNYSFITHDQGIYQWQVKANGDSNGGKQFQRECLLTGAVWPQKVSDTPPPDPRPDPDLNDGVVKGG